MKRTMNYLLDHPALGYVVAGLLGAASIVGIALQFGGAA